jgi:hypothetical protein
MAESEVKPAGGGVSRPVCRSVEGWLGGESMSIAAGVSGAREGWSSIKEAKVLVLGGASGFDVSNSLGFVRDGFSDPDRLISATAALRGFACLATFFGETMGSVFTGSALN